MATEWKIIPNDVKIAALTILESVTLPRCSKRCSAPITRVLVDSAGSILQFACDRHASTGGVSCSH
jgi:hypothetical protein